MNLKNFVEKLYMVFKISTKKSQFRSKHSAFTMKEIEIDEEKISSLLWS